MKVGTVLLYGEQACRGTTRRKFCRTDRWPIGIGTLTAKAQKAGICVACYVIGGAMKRTFGSAALSLGLLAVTAMAQDMMRGFDLSSADMVSAEMTRGQVEGALAIATANAPADFSG